MSVDLVIGGAGCMGTEIVKALVAKRREVAVLSRHVAVLDNYHLQHTDRRPGVADTITIGDITSDADVLNAFIKFRPVRVFLFASNTDVRATEDRPLFDVMPGPVAAVRVMQMCHEFGVKKLIFASSGGVYGNSPEQIPTPESAPIEPGTVYHTGKRVAELYAEYFYRRKKLAYTALRYAKVYGPGKSEAISIFCQSVLSDGKVNVHGDGSTTRDHLHAIDAGRIAVMAAESDFIGSINAGSGEEVSLNTILAHVRTASGRPLEISYKNMDCHQDRMCLDVTLAKEKLGFSPTVSMEKGVATVMAWEREKARERGAPL